MESLRLPGDDVEVAVLDAVRVVCDHKSAHPVPLDLKAVVIVVERLTAPLGQHRLYERGNRDVETKLAGLLFLGFSGNPFGWRFLLVSGLDALAQSIH